jgi:hypothetical protein
MAVPEHKAIATPDETREFPKGKVELINIGGGQVGRLTLSPAPSGARRPTSSTRCRGRST